MQTAKTAARRTVASAAARRAAPSRCVAPLATRSPVSTHALGTAGDRATSAPSDAELARVFNFSAGPACLPLDVLQEAQADLVNWKGSGMSVMEMSHRGPEFIGICDKAEADLRALMDIPDNYKVLFLQGGASTQFASIPLNLTQPGDKADFVVTGSWGSKAFAEAGKYCDTHKAADGKPGKFTDIPTEWDLRADSKYVHICMNETIQGVEFQAAPDVGDRLLVADVSSNFLSRPMDVSKYAVIYGGAQKNIGPSGVTIVIVREDLVGNARPDCPAMLDWATAAENGSMYNTPPCFSIYMAGLVFAKLLKEGGLTAVQAKNARKAAKLYAAIEESDGFYSAPVAPAVRSAMNVPFTMATPELEKAFLAECAAQGLIQLKGHRSVGGVRASIYNAMPEEGIDQLVDAMKSFQNAEEAKHN